MIRKAENRKKRGTFGGRHRAFKFRAGVVRGARDPLEIQREDARQGSFVPTDKRIVLRSDNAFGGLASIHFSTLYCVPNWLLLGLPIKDAGPAGGAGGGSAAAEASARVGGEIGRDVVAPARLASRSL